MTEFDSNRNNFFDPANNWEDQQELEEYLQKRNKQAAMESYIQQQVSGHHMNNAANEGILETLKEMGISQEDFNTLGDLETHRKAIKRAARKYVKRVVSKAKKKTLRSRRPSAPDSRGQQREIRRGSGIVENAKAHVDKGGLLNEDQEMDLLEAILKG